MFEWIAVATVCFNTFSSTSVIPEDHPTYYFDKCMQVVVERSSVPIKAKPLQKVYKIVPSEATVCDIARRHFWTQYNWRKHSLQVRSNDGDEVCEGCWKKRKWISNGHWEERK